MNVIVYSTPTCGYCHQVKHFLTERGIKFTEIDISRDREAADDMVQKTGQMGVPVIVIDGQAVVGFNRPRLEQLLAAGGNGSGRKHSFGLSIADASIITRKSGMPPVFGAYVGRVIPSSPADRAGIMHGDIITELNSKPVRNASDVENVFSSLDSGSLVILNFLRGENVLKAEVII